MIDKKKEIEMEERIRKKIELENLIRKKE